MTAAKAFTEDTAAREDRQRRFRFVYVSGFAVVRDQTKSLWFMGEYRKIRVGGTQLVCRRKVIM